MPSLSRLAKMAAVLVAAVFAQTVHALEAPECEALEQWAGELQPDETFAPVPEVQLSNLLRDALAVPLLGAPTIQWSSSDITQVRGAQPVSLGDEGQAEGQTALRRRQGHRRRRLSKDGEILARSAENMVRIAMLRIMLPKCV